MQQDIDQIMSTVTSSATAEAARQELQELVAHRVAALERERDQLAAELERERAALIERDQRLAALEQERNNAVAECDAALAKRVAARRERFALRQRVTTLEEEQASLRSKFSITRQDDLLRHVLSATVDFDHFTVRKVVAAGGNGIVLLCDVTVPAWCVPTDEAAAAAAAAAAAGARTAQVAVAVKVLAGVENPRHTLLKHRFLREFQTLSAMPPHPNVVTLLAYLTKCLPQPMYDLLPDGFRMLVGRLTNPVLALIMPLHPRTLEAAAAGAEPAQLVRWCLEVAAAVAHMWEYRWVHLDLKLNNVLVAGDGRAVLTDMGTAMFVAEDGSLTVPAQMGLEGNPAHRAPEVMAIWERANRMRDPAAQVRIDAGRQEVWALGVLLHELVAGKHPYGEEYPLEGRNGGAEVDEAQLLARGLPSDTVAVLRRMVNSEPAARPASPVAAYSALVASVPAAQRLAPAVPVPSLSYPAASAPAASAPAAYASAPAPLPSASSAALAVSPLVVEQVYHACQLSVSRDPVTGKKMPNEWGRKLQAWSEENAAARLCVALLMWGTFFRGLGGMQKDRAQARALAERSMAWCRGAAEGGEGVAQWLLGECYFRGMGVAGDRAQAAAWWRRAAQQGHAEALRRLGE